MIIKKENEVPITFLEEESTQKVSKRILIGPEDGSHRIVMRLFRVEPEGYTPYHTHDFEHVVKVEKGRGVIVDADGQERLLEEGNCVYVEPNEKHQFRNPFDQPFEFLCIIINQNS